MRRSRAPRCCVATVVLFYVSYWLLSKMEVAKWNHFVKSKVQDALTSGSALALASAAFLAVYREGFETVLFYKALFVPRTAPARCRWRAGCWPAALVLAGVYVAINRFGVRLAAQAVLRGDQRASSTTWRSSSRARASPSFRKGASSTTTVVTWAPRIPALGIYPTVESLAAQGLLLVLSVAALVWTFVIEPRRLARAGACRPLSIRLRLAVPHRPSRNHRRGE